MKKVYKTFLFVAFLVLLDLLWIQFIVETRTPIEWGLLSAITLIVLFAIMWYDDLNVHKDDDENITGAGGAA